MAPDSTPALVALEQIGVSHRVVRTGPVAGIEEAAEQRGVEVAEIVKTLVVRKGEGDYVFVLVPGDRSIDWAKLRAHLGLRRLSLPDQDEARGATGYPRGAITPFGSSRAWPVVADEGVLRPERVSMGGGAHGVSVEMTPADVVAALSAVIADVTKPA